MEKEFFETDGELESPVQQLIERSKISQLTAQELKQFGKSVEFVCQKYSGAMEIIAPFITGFYNAMSARQQSLELLQETKMEPTQEVAKLTAVEHPLNEPVSEPIAQPITEPVANQVSLATPTPAVKPAANPVPPPSPTKEVHRITCTKPDFPPGSRGCKNCGKPPSAHKIRASRSYNSR